MYYAALVALGVLAGAAIFSPNEASAEPKEKNAVVVRQPVVVEKPAAAVVHSAGGGAAVAPACRIVNGRRICR
jgi:hypothetical protein